MHATRFMKKLFYILFSITLSFSGQSHAVQKASIFDLEVTQKCVGFFEVEEKVKKMKSLAESDRKDFIKNEPIPVVLGPKGRMYMVDHHHLARAVFESGHQNVYVDPFLDLSHLDIEDFWQEMQNRKLTYLKDNGVDISYQDLPKNIKYTDDDIYRSLAGQVRKAGGYNKTTIPFAEFQWADFFRTRINIKPGKKGYQEAIQEALQLAKTDAAKNLPGHLSQKKSISCSRALIK